jgi:hypothetical protein
MRKNDGIAEWRNQMTVPPTFARRPLSSLEYPGFTEQGAALKAKMRTICRGC